MNSIPPGHPAIIQGPAMTEQTLGVVADPGLPQKIVDSLTNGLEQQLKHHFGSGTAWHIETSSEKLPLNAEGEIPFLSLARRMKQEKPWDYFIYVTDLPRLTGDTPMLSEIDYPAKAALISLPTLGAVSIKSSVRNLIVALLHLIESNQPPDDAALAKTIGVG